MYTPWTNNTTTSLIVPKFTLSIFHLLGSGAVCHVCGSSCCDYTSPEPYSGDSFSSTALLCWLILDEWNTQVWILNISGCVTKGELLIHTWSSSIFHCIIKLKLLTISFLILFVLFRTLRNIANCLREILDVLLVLLLMIAIFAVMGKVWKSS